MNETSCCAVCGESFVPDARVAKVQKVCPKPACRRERKRRADARWRAANPGYRDAAKTRRWAAVYPAYWRRWRSEHPDSVQRNREQTRQRMQATRLLFAKQDAIRRDPVGYLNSLRPGGLFAKQDAMAGAIDGLITFLTLRGMFAKPKDMASAGSGVASSCA